MAVQPTNKFGRKISNSHLSVESMISRANSYTVHTNNYVLNKVKALRKKLQQCGNEHLTYQMKANKNFVMKLSTSAYEMTKLVVIEQLYGDTFFKDYSIVSCIKEDECQNQVGSLYRIFNKKKDGSQGIQLKFSVNFYHTTSSILVNGNRVDIFESELFSSICDAIKASCTKLTIVNEQIAQALTEADNRLADGKNESETRPKEIENDTQGYVNPETTSLENLNDVSMEVINSSLPTQNVTLTENSTESQYICPSCEQTAESETIICEECGEWFHFDCVGLSNQSAEQIQSDVPFICLFCNDGILYAPDEHSEKTVNNSPKVDSTNANTKLNKNIDLTLQNSEVNDPDQNNSPPNETQNKKPKPRKNANAGSSKKAALSDQQETIFAQKYYISSLEAKVNNLESTVTLLKDTLHKSDIQTNTFQQGTSVRSDRDRSEAMGEHVVKSLENKLGVFEFQMMQNFTMQNQMNLQNHLNIQNQLTLLNTQVQFSFAQSQLQSMHGHRDPGNIYPVMAPITNQGPPMAVPQVVNYGGLPPYMSHGAPTHQQMVIPRPVMVSPPPYPGHGLMYLQQPPHRYHPYGIQPHMQPHHILPHHPNLMVPAQRSHAFPQNQVPIQPTTGPEPPSRMQTPVATSVEIPKTVPSMQPQQMDGRQASSDVVVQQGVLTDNREDHIRSTQQDNMDSSYINQDSQTGCINPGLPSEHSAGDAEVIVIDNDSTKTLEQNSCEQSTGNTVDSELHQPEISGKSDSKTHFLEIPSLKENPPEVDLLRSVVCAIQNRL